MITWLSYHTFFASCLGNYQKLNLWIIEQQEQPCLAQSQTIAGPQSVRCLTRVCAFASRSSA